MQYLQGGTGQYPQIEQSNRQTAQIRSASSTDSFRFVGSHDPIIELLCEFLSYLPSKHFLSASFKGSIDGLIALYQKEAEITGIHLWDSNSNEYNIPFVKLLFPFEPLTVVNLVQRTQGWIVPAGNPLNFNSWADISRKEVRLVNRQRGSGTRLRLDQYLSEQSISSAQIQGYDKEETTHLGVAMKIAGGEGNAGIGVQASAQKMGLDFIPLFKERYDLVVLQETTLRPEWQQIFTVLNSTSFHRAIEQQIGYDASLTGQVMYPVQPKAIV